MEEKSRHGEVGLAALRSGMDRKTARKYLATGRLPSESSPPREWRTRPDPFAEDWPGIAERLEAAPTLEGRALFEDLLGRYPERYTADVEERRAVVEVMRGYDAGPPEGLELPPGIERRAYGEWLHEQAVGKGVTFLDGMGFAPGLSNVTVGEGIRKLDRATSAVARVGGIPEKTAAGRHPLRYMITWAFDHVLRESMIRPEVRKDGEVVEVPAGSDRETFRFTRFGKDEVLECAVTPGMPSFMTSRTQLADFAEKTVRWPGHWSGVDTLKECGLLDLDPAPFRGGFPVAIAARILAQGTNREPGIVPPDDAITGPLYTRFIAELGQRNIRVEESVTEGERGGRPL